MTSKYHYIRNSKQAENEEAVKAYGPRTWGYDYANDGYRNIVDYNFLRKWLDSKIGQKWDDVWSEANKKWDSRTYVGKTALDYIWVHPVEKWYSDYYIKDGILKKAKRVKYNWPKPVTNFVRYEGKSYFRHENIWYAVETAVLKRDKHNYYAVDDVFLGCLSSNCGWSVGRVLRKFYGEVIYCTAKQQVGKRICRKLNAILFKESKKCV